MLRGFRTFALATFLLLPITGAHAADQVKVSVFKAVSDAGIYVALERGYFKAENIEIDLTQLDSASIVGTALASGQVDVAGGSPAAGVYNAIRQGIAMKIVADKGSMPTDGGYIGLVVRKGLDGQIKTPADLKGRIVALAGHGIGTTNEVAFDHMLKAAGQRGIDVKLQNLTFGDSLAALGSGSVDVAYLIEPLMTSAVARGLGTVMLTGDRMYLDQQVAVLLYGPQFWEKRADVAKRFMVAYLRGVRDYNDAFWKNRGRDDVVAILTRHTTVKQPELYGQMRMPGLNPNGTVNLAGMREDMQWFRSKGYLKEPVDLAVATEASFVNQAIEKLGRYE